MERSFNTAGPNRADTDYTLPPLSRFDLEEILNLIYRRDTHIDILIDKLKEPRVRRVIEPMLANSDNADDGLIPTDDIQYVEDMGLIKLERGKPRRGGSEMDTSSCLYFNLIIGVINCLSNYLRVT